MEERGRELRKKFLYEFGKEPPTIEDWREYGEIIRALKKNDIKRKDGTMGFFKKLGKKFDDRAKHSKIDAEIGKFLTNTALRVDKASVKHIVDLIEEGGIVYLFPEGLVDYMNQTKPGYTTTDLLEVYIRWKQSKRRNTQTLDKAKSLDIKKVKIRTAEDGNRVCAACQKASKKIHNINAVPELPICWECRCYYEPQV